MSAFYCAIKYNFEVIISSHRPQYHAHKRVPERKHLCVRGMGFYRLCWAQFWNTCVERLRQNLLCSFHCFMSILHPTSPKPASSLADWGEKVCIQNRKMPILMCFENTRVFCSHFALVFWAPRCVLLFSAQTRKCTRAFWVSCAKHLMCFENTFAPFFSKLLEVTSNFKNAIFEVIWSHLRFRNGHLFCVDLSSAGAFFRMDFYNVSQIIFTLLSDTFQNFLVRDLQITDGMI